MDEWRQTTLPSGERIVSEAIPHARSTAIGYWIGAGGRDEAAARAGVSHFIEHLLFKGSSRYTALEIAEIFDGFGGELNAATSREHTVVYSRIPERHLERSLDVIGDMVLSPSFDDLDSEREVVLEEIAMVEDSPQDLVHDLLGEAIFGPHPLGRPVIGTAEVIANVSRRALRSYHRALYSPGNIVVAAAGAVDHDRLVELVALAVGQRAQPADPARPSRALLGRRPKPAVRFLCKDTEQYHLCLGAPGLSRSDPRRFALSVLDAILGGSASSRLFQEIREKRGLAYSVYSFTSQYTETGQIGIYVGTRADNVAEAITIALEQIAAIASGAIPDRELARAKENLEGRILLSLESASTRMHRLGRALVTDTEILSPEQMIDEIGTVDRDAVSALAAELLAPGRLAVAGIGPSEERFHAAVEGLAATAARVA